ncbi:aconitase, partial [Athelia psychrophila]
SPTPPVTSSLPADTTPKRTPSKRPSRTGPRVQVAVDPKSDRFQLLTAFEKWDGKTPTDPPIVIKVIGKCTTNHISASGLWLKYRGHLQNIPQNCPIGASNSENGEANKIKNQVTGEFGAVSEVGGFYRDNRIKWAVIGDLRNQNTGLESLPT